MARDRLRRDKTPIPHVAAAKQLRVAIQDLLVKARFRNAEAVLLTRHRSEVAAEQDKRAILGATEERDDRVVGIMKVDPFEAAVVEIDFE